MAAYTVFSAPCHAGMPTSALPRFESQVNARLPVPSWMPVDV